MPYLKNDIISRFHQKVYGSAGSLVTIYATHGDVHIVEDHTGERFAVHDDDLCDQPGAVAARKVEIPEASGKTSKKKGKPVNQSNLFN